MHFPGAGYSVLSSLTILIWDVFVLGGRFGQRSSDDIEQLTFYLQALVTFAGFTSSEFRAFERNFKKNSYKLEFNSPLVLFLPRKGTIGWDGEEISPVGHVKKIAFISPKAQLGRSSYTGCDWYCAVYDIAAKILYIDLPVKRDAAYESTYCLRGAFEQTANPKADPKCLLIAPSIRVKPMPKDPRFELLSACGESMFVVPGVRKFIMFFK